jgi:hypothetical protein
LTAGCSSTAAIRCAKLFCTAEQPAASSPSVGVTVSGSAGPAPQLRNPGASCPVLSTYSV